jgi:hypothetical protein
LIPAVIFLHGFGARYDLPISLALYLYAAGGVVIISFVLVAIFAGQKSGAGAIVYPRWRFRRVEPIFNSAAVRSAGYTIGVLALVAIVSTGLFGSSDPTRNPSEYLVWIYFWAGLVILSGLAGNLWTLFNPWAGIYALLRRVVPATERPLPRAMGIWPAAALYFAFACLELTSGMANRPWLIATLALLYSLVTLAGMFGYGGAAWLKQCEAFTVLFGIVSRFSPVETAAEGGRLQVWLRPWGFGLLQPMQAGWDRITFIVLMLSTLAFDGILATPVWPAFYGALSPLAGIASFGNFIVRTLGLMVLTVIFLTAFVAVTRLVLFYGWDELKSPLGRWRGFDWMGGMTAFALTLVPIALVYNAAHDYSYLVVQSQGLFPLLPDPFARGWDLFPSLVGYQPSFALAQASTVWYVQVVLIVLGHVVAMYLAHLRAAERFKKATNVLGSQYPMLFLMVLYTMTSLWILAQPVTREI